MNCFKPKEYLRKYKINSVKDYILLPQSDNISSLFKEIFLNSSFNSLNSSNYTPFLTNILLNYGYYTLTSKYFNDMQNAKNYYGVK